MFAFAILIGVYSYLLFILGITHLLYPWAVSLVTILWFCGVVFWFRNDVKKLVKVIPKLRVSVFSLSTFSKACIVLLTLLWGINLIGVFAPEISFDALWYHLTIPKIFAENNEFFFIPGGLYYYSLMPKLIDMLYIPAVMLGSDTLAKAIHYGFGILTLIVLYKISKKYLSTPISLLVLLIFSSNLVVAWQATTAYIDLGRTFFETMAIYGIVLYIHEKKKLWLTESAIMIGFAITSKLIAVFSLPIFVIILLYLHKDSLSKGLVISIKYVLTALIIPLPYFIFSTLNTGNPFYPLFTQYYSQIVEPGTRSLFQILADYWNLFVNAADPINPLYLIVFPIVIFLYKRLTKQERLFVIYAGLSLVVWYFIPRTGGGRFILPYLPVFSLVIGLVLSKLTNSYLKKAIIGIGLIVALTTIGYRSVASSKYLSVVFGQQTRSEYLAENLNFSFGDFYDTDGYLSQTLTASNTVLVYDVHNLYYADFNFIHESYVQSGDEFTYILAPSMMRLPERFYAWKPLYDNPITGLTLYSQEGSTWVY
ncbi:MAG TPA: glycosyltransferase family 39 protein [Candidatus Levybacteria bacterium]|mgnify:CR=1 FL=1|nr:glycosyltransferase family 39 protein [Candidatus Levybacteria bacterium]